MGIWRGIDRCCLVPTRLDRATEHRCERIADVAWSAARFLHTCECRCTCRSTIEVPNAGQTDPARRPPAPDPRGSRPWTRRYPQRAPEFREAHPTALTNLGESQ